MTNNPFDAIQEQLNTLNETVAAIQSNSRDEIIDRAELLKRLNITEPTIIRYEKKGVIPALRIGSCVRYNWPRVVKALEK